MKRRIKERMMFFLQTSMPRVRKTAEMKRPVPQITGSARGNRFYNITYA